MLFNTSRVIRTQVKLKEGDHWMIIGSTPGEVKVPLNLLGISCSVCRECFYNDSWHCLRENTPKLQGWVMLHAQQHSTVAGVATVHRTLQEKYTPRAAQTSHMFHLLLYFINKVFISASACDRLLWCNFLHNTGHKPAYKSHLLPVSCNGTITHIILV